MSPYLVTFSVGWFARLLIETFQVAGSQQFDAPWVSLMEEWRLKRLDEEQASLWGHSADVLSHWWGPTAVKTGMWVQFSPFFLNARRCPLPPWDVFPSTGFQPRNSWINCIKSHSTWSSKISVWTIGELDTLHIRNTCPGVVNRRSGNLTHFYVQLNS